MLFVFFFVFVYFFFFFFINNFSPSWAASSSSPHNTQLKGRRGSIGGRRATVLEALYVILVTFWGNYLLCCRFPTVCDGFTPLFSQKNRENEVKEKVGCRKMFCFCLCSFSGILVHQLRLCGHGESRSNSI